MERFRVRCGSFGIATGKNALVPIGPDCGMCLGPRGTMRMCVRLLGKTSLRSLGDA